MPTDACHPTRPPAQRARAPLQRQLRRHERGRRGGRGELPPPLGTGRAPGAGGRGRGRALRPARAAPAGLLRPPLAGLQRPPQGPPHGPAGDLRPRGLASRAGPLLTAQRRIDPGHPLRRARYGRVEPCAHARRHHRRLHLALAPHPGAPVCATLPNSVQRLAGRGPLRTAHQRGSRWPGHAGRTVLIPQPPSPDPRQRALAGGLRPPLGGHLSGPPPKARACPLHTGPSHVRRWVC